MFLHKVNIWSNFSFKMTNRLQNLLFASIKYFIFRKLVNTSPTKTISTLNKWYAERRKLNHSSYRNINPFIKSNLFLINTIVFFNFSGNSSSLDLIKYGCMHVVNKFFHCSQTEIKVNYKYVKLSRFKHVTCVRQV